MEKSTLAEIEQEIELFYNSISDQFPDYRDVEEICEYAEGLMGAMARVGKLHSDSRYWLNEATKDSIVENLTKNVGLSPSVLKELVKVTCKRQHYCCDMTEKIYKTICRQFEFCRSIISKEKVEKSLAFGGVNN